MLQNFELFCDRLSDDHDARTTLFFYYAVLKLEQFQLWGRIEDLEEAIEKAKQAVDSTAKENPYFVERLNNLGIMLERRYERTRRIEDLEEAIRLTKQAIKVTSDDHPDLVACLNSLSVKLHSRYERTRKIEDLEEAIKLARQAIKVLQARSITWATIFEADMNA